MSDFSRVIGRRQSRSLGQLRAPSPEELLWARRMAPAQTRVPKGIFRYRSIEEAGAEWARWQADAITAKAKQ